MCPTVFLPHSSKSAIYSSIYHYTDHLYFEKNQHGGPHGPETLNWSKKCAPLQRFDPLWRLLQAEAQQKKHQKNILHTDLSLCYQKCIFSKRRLLNVSIARDQSLERLQFDWSVVFTLSFTCFVNLNCVIFLCWDMWRCKKQLYQPHIFVNVWLCKVLY